MFVVLGATILVQGCGGGGGGGSSTTTTSTGIHPSAKTTSDVSSLLSGYGLTIVCNSFTGYGPRLQTHGSELFDSNLGLWYKIIIAPDGTFEKMFQDQAETIPAGSLSYTVNDAAQTMGGDFSVTGGLYAGLTGTYLQSVQSAGSNGSISFAIPNIGTTDSQFEISIDSTGAISGASTVGVALQSGYLQTEVVNFFANGFSSSSTTDSNGIKSAFNFTNTFSGSGTITGSDPGLPATLSWGVGGNGVLTYKDGSNVNIINWQLNAGSGKVHSH